jgi:hypothetical protein
MIFRIVRSQLLGSTTELRRPKLEEIIVNGWISAIALWLCDSEALSRTLIRDKAELFERSWSKRVWVLQEVAMARKARIMCGPYSCPARTFALMPFLM